jgi:ATP-dependent protease HslVU (ClpYQ) ATPase subunit
MATLMEDVLFELPEGSTKALVFDGARVRERLAAIVTNDDLRRYIL